MSIKVSIINYQNWTDRKYFKDSKALIEHLGNIKGVCPRVDDYNPKIL